MIPIAMAPRSYKWTVLYDANCGFCKWALARVLRLDRHRRLRPIALDSAEARELLDDLPQATREASWHLVGPEPERRRSSAGAAAPPLLRLLPGGRLPAAVLAAAPRLTDRAYRWVAEHRSTLGRAVPSRAKRRATERIALHDDDSH
jgi:predicted DCC family thiol-disulfide oxidoreductase YuxK